MVVINMAEENISQEFVLRKVEEARNYFIKEINQNDLISKKHKNVCTALHDTELSVILFSAVT